MQNQKQRKSKKEFSILKWIIFPGITLVLAGIIVWFNISVFGWADGAPYIGIAAAITFFAICINKYTNSENRGLVIGAFCFEIVLFLALLLNAAFSLSVQREMSVARQNKLDVEQLRKLDRRAQRNLTRNYRGVAAIFGDNERGLYWIFVLEMLAFGVSAFSIYAIAQVVERKEQPRPQEYAPAPGGGTRYQDEMDSRWASKSPAMSPAPQTARAQDPKS